MEKDISEKEAWQIIGIISKNKKAWVSIMIVVELGIIESNDKYSDCPSRIPFVKKILTSEFLLINIIAQLCNNEKGA